MVGVLKLVKEDEQDTDTSEEIQSQPTYDLGVEVNGERAVMLECYYGYRQFFESRGIEPLSVHGDNKSQTKEDMLKHAAAYLPALHSRITAARLGDAKSLLFMVQGILWTQGCFSLNELRDHNRSI